MPDIESVVEVANRLTEGGVSLERSLCVRARNRNAGCDACVAACSQGCVSFQGTEASFDAERCTECGACVAACPTGALSLRWKSREELLDAGLAACDACGGTMAFACTRLLEDASGLVDLTKVADVPCLEAVDPDLLVEAAAFAGVRNVRLAHGDCGSCRQGSGREAARRCAAVAKELVEAWGGEVDVTVSPKLPSAARLRGDEGYDPNRRLFFSDVRDAAKDAAQASLDCALEGGVPEEGREERRPVRVNRFGVLPHGQSARRDRLLEALGCLPGPSGEEVVGTDVWARLRIDGDACTGCRMCAVFCPTGALYGFHTKKGLVGVKHRIAACVQCGCCRDVCPEGAIGLEPGAAARQVAEDEVQRFVLPRLAPRNGFRLEGVHVV